MDYPQAIVSIVVLCICVLIGIPLWWNTTKVYRADLPHHQIQSLQSSPIKLKITVKIYTVLHSKPVELKSFENILREKKNLLKGNENFELDYYVVGVSLELEKDVEKYCNKFQALPNYPASEKLTYNLLIVHDSSQSEHFKYYCHHGLDTVLVLSNLTDTTPTAEMIHSLMKVYIPVEDLVKRSIIESKNLKNRNSQRTLPPSPGYRLAFVLAIANPLDSLQTWNIQGAINKYLKPLLKSLDFMGPFHVSSQVLYFADVSIKPSKAGEHFYYPKSKLPLLINPLESWLNTYTSNDAGLNFIVYIPPVKYLPLFIKDKKTDRKRYTAFHSARWGGVQFYNPANNSLQNGTNIPIDELMKTFVDQFQTLVGINLADHTHIFTQNKQKLLAEWIRIRLLMFKTFEHLAASISTLSSLSKLLDEIANIVIGDEIKELVERSVESIGLSRQYLESGLIEKAYVSSKKAFLSSEKAFYDASLLALLYFPDDQKYAIYVPLFLPVAIPIVLSFVKAVKWLRKGPVEEKLKEE